jgi:putative ABC transport system permease protein
MMLLFKMGLKNIGRKMSRSVLTVAAVSVCSMGILLFMIVMDGSVDMMMSGIIGQFGHARLVHEKVLKKRRLYQNSHFVGHAKQLIKDIKKLPGVKAVAPRIQMGAYIDHKGIQAPAGGLGIDPHAEAIAMKLDKKIKKGRMLRTKGREVVLGWRLARRLKAKPGERIVMVGQTVNDSISALRVKVVGIAFTGIAQVDKMFYVSIPSAQYYLDIPNQLSTLLIFANNIQAGDELLTRLKQFQQPKGVALQGWRESSFFAKMLPMVDLYIIFLGGLIVFIAGVGLMNTMTMSVLERRGEVGIMMALGFRPFEVAFVFLVEGILLGILGAIIGVIIASLLAIPLVTTGLTIQSDALANFPYPMEQTLKGSYTVGSVIAGFLVGVLSTLAGTLIPAIQAARMAPVDALRDE